MSFGGIPPYLLKYKSGFKSMKAVINLILILVFYTLLFPILVTGEEIDDAVFVAQYVPSFMVTGEKYNITIVMNNTGTTTWNSFSIQNYYTLGSQNPQDNRKFHINRVFLSPRETIEPGQVKNFTFEVAAPLTPGTYNFQWRMLKVSKEEISWFGELTPNIEVIVFEDSLNLSVKHNTGVASSGVGIGNLDKDFCREIVAGEWRLRNGSGNVFPTISAYNYNNSKWEISWTTPIDVPPAGIDVGDVDDDGIDEVAVGHIFDGDVSRELRIKEIAELFDHDGKNLWKFTIPYTYVRGGMARQVRIGELDGNHSNKEIALVGGSNAGDLRDGYLIILNKEDQIILNKSIVKCGSSEICPYLPNWWFKLQTLRIADVDQDGANELVITGGWLNYGNVHLVKNNGSRVFKVNVGNDALGVAVDDFMPTLQGLEIAVPSAKRIDYSIREYFNYSHNKVTLLNHKGDILWQKNISKPAWSAASGDINGNGEKEIIIGYGVFEDVSITKEFHSGGVVVFDKYGTVIGNIELPNAVNFLETGDLNNDGVDEIVANVINSGVYIIASAYSLPYRHGDLTKDCVIDIADLVSIGRDLGKTRSDAPESDLNQDGEIDIFDIVAVAKNIF